MRIFYKNLFIQVSDTLLFAFGTKQYFFFILLHSERQNAVKLKSYQIYQQCILLLWYSGMCSHIRRRQCFGETCWHHLQLKTSALKMEAVCFFHANILEENDCLHFQNKTAPTLKMEAVRPSFISVFWRTYYLCLQCKNLYLKDGGTTFL